MVRHSWSSGFHFQNKFLSLLLHFYKLYMLFFFPRDWTLQTSKYAMHFIYLWLSPKCMYLWLFSQRSEIVIKSELSLKEQRDRYFWCLDVTWMLDERTVFLNIFALWFFIDPCRFQSLYWQGERQWAPLWFGIWTFSFKGLPKQHWVKVVCLGVTGQTKVLVVPHKI